MIDINHNMFHNNGYEKVKNLGILNPFFWLQEVWNDELLLYFGGLKTYHRLEGWDVRGND